MSESQFRLVTLDESLLGEAAELEKLCFSEPWSAEALSILTQPGGLGVAALQDGHAVAYGGMTYVLDEGNITNIAVRPEYRKHGFGRAVTEKLLAEAQQKQLKNVFLEVRQSNDAAQRLYERVGFRRCGIRKNFYRRPTESAVLMVCDVSEFEEKRRTNDDCVGY